jgi:hypothetical protein
MAASASTSSFCLAGYSTSLHSLRDIISRFILRYYAIDALIFQTLDNHLIEIYTFFFKAMKPKPTMLLASNVWNENVVFFARVAEERR